MAPSLRQTLLREPTRSYQSIYQEGNGSNGGAGGGYGSASSSRRGPSSIRSASSYDSFGRSTGATSPGPSWVNGQWEWSQYGGRKGLTGGARSLYTPSVVGRSIGAGTKSSAMSLRSERLRSDDGGSIRSERSMGGQSVRSTMSLPNGDQRRRASSRDIAQAVSEVGRDSAAPRRNRTQSANTPSTSSRRRQDDFPSISSGLDQGTSRRYSSAPAPAPTSSRSSPSPTPLPVSSRPSRSKSPLRHASDDTTPSLTSSASSAPSSPPVTPAQSLPNLHSPLGPDGAKSRSRSGHVSPGAILAATNAQLPQEESPVVSPIEEKSTDSTSQGLPQRFYSVDEFFAIAGSPSTEPDSTASNDAEPSSTARSRQESDEVSFKTAADIPSPSSPALHQQPSVPRLKLTRTESDQSRAGIKGAVDLDDENSEEDDTAASTPLSTIPDEEESNEVVEETKPRTGAPQLAREVSPENLNDQPPSSSPSRPVKADTTGDTSYEVVRSSQPRRSASTPAGSTLSAESASSSAVGDYEDDVASVDVPDWLQRIRALGEPIDTIQPRIPPSNKKKLTPPPHWTVLQLRAQEQKNANRPNMMRPRSVGSLRNRTNPMIGLPEVDEEEEPPVPAFPAWLHKKGQDSSLRAPSPANGSLTRTPSGSSQRSNGSDSTHRRTRSMDLPVGSSTISPLNRVLSTSSSRPASISSQGSQKQSRLSKLLAPPLASSKAVREPDPEPVKNESLSRASSYRGSPSPSISSRRASPPARASSLREALAIRDGPSRPSQQQTDAASSYGGSQLSMMSAPQLSPVRPPRNPARRSSLSVTGAEETPRASSRPASINYSPVDRLSRPNSIANVSREPRLPPPVAPIFPESQAASAATSQANSRANSRAPSLSSGVTSSRPLSSYLPPANIEMSSLVISPRLETAKKTSKRFSLFRSSTSSNANATKRFEPSIDLLYERLDGAAVTKRLRNDEVLIEAIAVGLDRWDVEKAWSVAKTSGGAGWNPGRAVYGKVVARGDGVSRVKKGDLVWGLTPLKKSAGLASLVALPRDNVSLAPQFEDNSVDQIAALAADAVTAFQVMESFAKELPKGSKILILNAHQGIGYLCLQLARYLRPGASGGRDLWVVAQVPVSVIDGEAFCRNAGATDVVRDEPLAALNGLHEGSFDVVIDNVGGRRLYDASRRILHNSGSFVSTVGDSLGPDSPSTPSAYQTSLRSLRRTFFKKDKKSVSYWLASHEVDERESIREVLDKVKEAVEANALVAKVGRSLAFSEARLAFDEKEVSDGFTSVVRIKEL